MTKQEILDSIKFTDYDADSDKVELSYGGLARALYPDVEWFFDMQEGNYQGDWYMVGKDKEGKYYFFTMGYGSCSGCDWLQSAICGREDGRTELAKIIDKILDTPILPSKDAALEYARKFDWQNAYDRDENNPLVKEVVESIEKS